IELLVDVVPDLLLHFTLGLWNGVEAHLRLVELDADLAHLLAHAFIDLALLHALLELPVLAVELLVHLTQLGGALLVAADARSLGAWLLAFPNHLGALLPDLLLQLGLLALERPFSVLAEVT